jgi:4-carboxymuconolactone decarboxylase
MMKVGITLTVALWVGLVFNPVGASAVAKETAKGGKEAAAVAKPPGDPGCLPRASDGVPEPTWDEKHAAGDKAAMAMFGGQIGKQVTAPSSTGVVTPELASLARDFAFGSLWSRCGLTRKERSLVTLGILMALRANSQLAEHFKVAKNNGVTRREMEEAIYQATGYAGFPAGANAREVLIQVLQSEASAENDGQK